MIFGRPLGESSPNMQRMHSRRPSWRRASAERYPPRAMASSELKGAIRRHPIWQPASDKGIEALSVAAKDERYRPGQAVLTAGQLADRHHLLLEGAVRVFYPLAGGREVTVKLFWAPAAFGDAESILKTRWAETVQALTPARVLVIEVRRYLHILRREPAVCFRQYWDVSRRFGVAIHTEKAANLAEVGDRVIALLVAYTQHFPSRTLDGEVLIDFPLTQDDIAVQVASNRRTVAQVIAGLYKKKLVVRAGRRYLIPSVDRLLDAARRSQPALSFQSDPAPWIEVP
jgi:CRP-like cAMP-binding protein